MATEREILVQALQVLSNKIDVLVQDRNNIVELVNRQLIDIDAEKAKLQEHPKPDTKGDTHAH